MGGEIRRLFVVSAELAGIVYITIEVDPVDIFDGQFVPFLWQKRVEIWNVNIHWYHSV